MTFHVQRLFSKHKLRAASGIRDWGQLKEFQILALSFQRSFQQANLAASRVMGQGTQ